MKPWAMAPRLHLEKIRKSEVWESEVANREGILTYHAASAHFEDSSLGGKLPIAEALGDIGRHSGDTWMPWMPHDATRCHKSHADARGDKQHI